MQTSARSFLIIALVVLAGTLEVRPQALSSISPSNGDRSRQEIRQLLESRGAVTICVALDDQAVPGETSWTRLRRHTRKQSRVIDALPRAGCRLGHRFAHSPVLTLEISSMKALEALEKTPGIRRLDLDLRGGGALLESSVMIRAGQAHEEFNVRGEDRVVAILDTGVNASHPDLAEANLIHQYHFLDQGEDTGPGAEDDNGHGSHITGIIVSQGHLAGRGIAPATGIVSLKVLDDDNRGWVSDWTRGLEHLIDLHDTAVQAMVQGDPPGGIFIDVINLSLTTDLEFEGICDVVESAPLQAFADTCKAAHERGIIIVGASGNGASTTKMGSPACFSSVISVGSVRDVIAGDISGFTNRNEHLDLLAPGQFITSAGTGDLLRTYQGTSQAVPHVAAVAAMLRQVRDSFQPEDVLRLLQETGVEVIDSKTGATYRRIDAYEAIKSSMHPSVDGLMCQFDWESELLTTSWQPLDEEVTIRFRLYSHGELVIEENLPGNSGSRTLAELEPGPHEVLVSAVVSGGEGPPSSCAAEVFVGPPFRRADCNDDGGLNLADPVFLLLELYGHGVGINCEVSCDSNDDGDLGLTDAIYSLNYMFKNGPPPPAPYPQCGSGSTGSSLGCAVSSCN